MGKLRTTLHKPTAEELRIIRDAAKREAGSGNVRIEAGSRCNIEEGGIDTNINIRLVSKHRDDYDDTDLHDQHSWAEFKKFGFDFAPGGRALIDFYVSTTGDWGQLEGNVNAFWENNELVKVTGTMGNVYWNR